MKKEKVMKNIMMIISLLIPTIAFAHPVDDACAPGQTESCQAPYAHLGLNNPTFFACHRSYWHHRRVLEKVIRDYATCGGAVNELHSLLGWAPVVLEPVVLNYWDLIPAHPVVDKPGNLAYCEAQKEAAEYTVGYFGTFANACSLYKAFLRAMFF